MVEGIKNHFFAQTINEVLQRSKKTRQTYWVDQKPDLDGQAVIGKMPRSAQLTNVTPKEDTVISEKATPQA